MKRNYYIAGFTWDGDSQLDRFKEEHIWENGYDEKYEDVYNTMRVGDHIALKSTYVKNSKSYLRIYCMGVIKKIHADNMRVEVDWKDCRKDLTDITWYANTLCKIDNEEHIKRIFNMDNYEETKQDLAELLTTNHNLILTGAPGTGKTYLAKQIAQQLIFGEAKGNLTADEQKRFDEQCGFVQFHPSYDYTDFVEGLRPIQDDNGNVGFERKDGVFKEFCKKAEKNWIDSKKSIDVLQEEFDNKELIDSFLSNAINEETVYRTKTGTEFNIADFDDDRISIKILRNKIRGNIDIDININKHKIFKLLENDVPLNNVRDIKQFFGYTNTQHRDSYIFTICNEIRNLPKVKSVQIDPIVCQNFVFIIDEINRGEISKIFGELFFSIDPGYRGKNGKVKTQYQNLVEVGDEFYDGFFVPENLYIIGTMNDIDRSVESMDFAFRRRFAFKEIKADDNIEMLEELGELKDEAIERMKRLNTEISKIEGLSSAYHIGAAYFLKLKNYKDDADKGINSLWENHIKGLLVEYLRGMQDADEKLEKLEKAYNDDKDHSKKDKDNSEENKDNESTENIG
ncbi:MAG: AAA family ATPase [Bacteroidales bacterium]|nr:AAA family ATPase [Bacteroidales bacterium]